MVTRDNKIVISGQNLVPGHTYEIAVVAKDEAGRQASIDTAPKAVITIQGKLETPGVPTGFAATSGLTTIYLAWTLPDDSDIESIEITRADTDTLPAGTVIANTKGTSYSDLIGSVGTTRYYWLRAKSRSGKYSDYTAVASATTAGVAPTDVSDFAITASKTFTKIPILDGDAWTDNSPDAGKISWNQHNLVFNGAWYQVAAGASNTTSKYVYWTVGHTSGAGTVASPYATTYSVAAAAPTLDDTKFIIATNVAGVHSLAWNSMANQVIGTAYILDAAIIDAKIASCAVDKLTAGSITSKSITLAVAAGTGDVKIQAGAKNDFNNVNTGFILGIDDSDGDTPKFYIGSSSSYLNWDGTTLTIRGSLNADDIGAGTLTGRVVQTAASGQRAKMDSADNTLKFYVGAESAACLTINASIAAGRPGILISRDGGGAIHIDNTTNGAYAEIRDDNFIICTDGTYIPIYIATISGVPYCASATGFSDGVHKVLGAQGAAVANATDAASVIARLNDLLSRLRTHGLIAT